MKETYPDTKFVFPSGKTVFGTTYIIHKDKALTGRQILYIIKDLDPNTWVHLFRRTKGEQVARRYGRTLESVFMVKDTLDLSKDETAFRYVQQTVPKLETGETT